jgi:hypothetical protein
MKSISTILLKTYGLKSEIYLVWLKKLKSEKIRFVIINLPIHYQINTTPGDLDIVVHPDDYVKAEKVLKKNYFVNIERFISNGQKIYTLYDSLNFNKIHLYRNVSYYNTNIISFDEIYKNSVVVEGFNYPNIKMDYVILLIESFFKKKYHYYERIQNLGIQSKDIKIFFKIFKNYKFIYFLNLNYLSNRKINTRYQIINIYKYFPKKYIRITNFIAKKGFISIKSKFIWNRRGRLIFFIGIDGSGKSALAKEFYKKINDGGLIGKYAYWGLKITFIQRLRQKIVKSRGGNAGNDGHSVKLTGGIADNLEKKSKILSSIFYFVLTLAYIIDYWILIFKDLTFISNENNILIVDRSYYDKLSDTSIILNRLFYYCLPKPDCIIRLNGDLDIFYNRKKEFAVEDLKILNDRVDNIIFYAKKKNTSTIEIDTVKNNIDQSIGLVLDKIWKDL